MNRTRNTQDGYFGRWHTRENSKSSLAGKGAVRVAILAVVLCALASFGLGVDYIFQPQRFPMKHISIKGDLHNTEPSQIRQAIAQVVASSNILRIDIAKAVVAAQALPWVEDATIKRRWPDTLVVFVNERVIRARWNDDQWLDHQGIAVTLPDFQDSSLPLLRGPVGFEQEVLAKFQIWQTLAQPRGLEIAELVKSGRDSWEVYVHPVSGDGSSGEQEVQSMAPNSIRVILGSSKPQARFERFAKLYSDVFEPAGKWLTAVDMRYPDGVSVQWLDGEPRIAGDAKIKKS